MPNAEGFTDFSDELGRQLGAVGITDGRHYARLDDHTATLQTIDYAHHEIHEGNSFFAIYSAQADNTDVVEMRFEVAAGAVYPHYTVEVISALGAAYRFWKGTTKTDNATNRLTMINRDFNSAKTSVITACHTPGGTESADPTIGPVYIGAAGGGASIEAGGAIFGRVEFILVPGQAYLIQATSLVNSNSLILEINGYEHTVPDEMEPA